MENDVCVFDGHMLTAFIAACGGGSTPLSNALTATLSADQAAYESFRLSPNASYECDWKLPLSGLPQSGRHKHSNASAYVPFLAHSCDVVYCDLQSS